MKQKIVSLVATAAIITAAATTVQAEEVTVKKGDTLWGFSQDYGVSVESIKKWNNLSSDLIFPEDVLTVSPYITVKVKKGDTLWDIAQANNVCVEDLKDWNNLTSDIIHPGLNVKVYTEKETVSKEQPKRTKVTATVTNKGQAIENTQTEAATPAPQKEEGSQAVSVKKEAKPAEEPKQEVAQASKAPEEKEEANKVITVEATAYTASCEGCSGITSTGINLKENPDAKVISVDPSVIPLGSKVHVEGYGTATAADTGGAIKGNKIDVFIPDHDDAVKYGRQQVKVEIID
ncbi:LysM peptidoglycan-binding and 3D domain-containing protein [Mesobacillus maritimus]|uniref:LysM peptidoglycan-binding domain-containing protein n=1 Tax=Mesobacillus maritimus TaxID=1643336 RepID=A0ABS7KBQ7_9BACI|nr:3D domain-containing protein [Mesobacillus maritimus]MBY0099711.1 LysM peptidoglycan-binding domain-containing protein [Mesobacillus maritimus]